MLKEIIFTILFFLYGVLSTPIKRNESNIETYTQSNERTETKRSKCLGETTVNNVVKLISPEKDDDSKTRRMGGDDISKNSETAKPEEEEKLIQSDVLSAPLKQKESADTKSESNETDDLESKTLGETIVNSVLKLISPKNDTDDIFHPETRRFGSSILRSYLGGDGESDVTKRTGEPKKEEKVSTDGLIKYAFDGYNLFNHVINDEEAMEYLKSLYRRDAKGWLDAVYNENTIKWTNSLYNQVKKDIANHIVNAKIDSFPVLSPVRSVLKVLTPLTGGDPTKAIVSKVVDYITL